MSCPCCLRLAQVTAFVTNSGDVPVCELVLKPLTTGTVYSFWPDWASSSSYEVFFSPKQVTGAGTQHTSFRKFQGLLSHSKPWPCTA